MAGVGVRGRVRGLLAVWAAGVVVGSGLVVAPLPAAGVVGVPAGVDDDLSVPSGSVPVVGAEDSEAEDATVVSAPEGFVPVWPGAGSGVVPVPVAVGRSLVGDVAGVGAVPGVSVLADGAAGAVLRPGSGMGVGSGPGEVDLGAAPPLVVGGLPPGGLAEVRVVGFSPAVAERLGAAQVFAVERADGVLDGSAVDVRVDYSGFAGAFGGGFADRLGLVRLPGCAVTTPELAGCSAVPRPVEVVNDPSAMWLTGRVPVGGDRFAERELFAAMGEPSELGEFDDVLVVTSLLQGGSTGDFSASDLNPGGTWQVGLSSGGFGFSYPVPEPPLVAGSGLGLSLDYDAQSVDAFTQSTNNQSGWVGLGWSLSPGFIERRFVACSEDVGDGSPVEDPDQDVWGDLCWESPDENDGEGDTDDFTTSELFLSLNGVSTRIVKDRVSGQWRTERDHGWRLEYETGGPGGDYWVVSTLDGTRYRFGYTDDANLRVPVVGDDPGEPNYSGYPLAYHQTWRWYLDRVMDRDENTTTLVWDEEVNHYKRWETGNVVEYARGAHLELVEYGYNHQVTGSVVTAQTDFVSMPRCVEATVRDDPVADPYTSGDCPSVSAANAGSYPDVPVDLLCSSSSCSHFSPSFFSTQRLERVTTYQWDPGDETFYNIFRLVVRFKTLNPPGLTGQVLWLDRIFPVGLIGPDSGMVRLPPVNFDVEYLPGRVDHAESEHGVSEMILPRIDVVKNGYGGRIDVSYGHVAGCPTSGSATGNDEYWDWYAGKVGNWDVNTEECSPVWFKPVGAPAGWGQFHKYLALQVVESDLVGGSPDVVTEYEYVGDAAWALGYRFAPGGGSGESWNEWRGYPTVRVHTGSGTDPGGYSMVESTFFRGLYYDYLDDYSTQKNVTLMDFDGGTWNDYPGRAGLPLQTRHYQMTGYDPDLQDRTFTEVASSRFEYRWTSTGDGPGWRNPRMAQRSYQRDRVRLDGGSWRVDSQRVQAFDAFGLPTEVVDYNQVGATGDEVCTTIGYAQHSSGDHYNIDLPETVDSWQGDTCAAGDLLARTVSLYDGNTSAGSQAPIDGDPTEVRTFTTPTAFVASKASFDHYGRVTSSTDPLDETATIDYDPASNWPSNGITTTNPAGHTSTVWIARAAGAPYRVVDPNGKQTDVTFDPLGRPVEVYLPGDPQTGGIASLEFEYTYTFNGTTGQPTAATRVATHTLASKTGGGQYLTSQVFDDGFGRARETQTTSPAGGRIISASYYNPRGLPEAATAGFHNTGDPGSGLANPNLDDVPSWTHTAYDTLSRPTTTTLMAQDIPLWDTSVEYFGDHTTTTPPDGAAPVTVWSDVRGNTTLRREHLDGGASVDITYTYDLTDRLVEVEDDAANVWTYTYDLAGRKTQTTDPDAGTTTFSYDAAGRLISTTDARSQTISTDYDEIGRPIARWDGPTGTGSLLAEWVYDTLADGQLTSATRWHDTDPYTTTVDGYTDRYQPTGTTVTIPTAEGALAGTYEYAYTYTDAGWAESVTLPAAGGMPAETLTTTYTPLGQADTLTSDWDTATTYVHATSYDKTGDLIQQLLGGTGAQVSRDLAYDEATGRLEALTAIAGADTTTPVTVQDDTYTYDPAGNLTTLTDQTTGQAQCFTYDLLRRLVEAWTTTTTTPCTTAPGTSTVQGPDAYWHTWTFDNLGSRLTQVIHPTAAGGDEITTTYTYPTSGQPHTLTQTSLTDPSGTVVSGYTYDQTGNTTSRPGGNGQQTLTWTPEGNLDTVSDTAGTTDYVYHPDGNRLITHHADGTATLYLPEGVEVHADTTGGTTCTRYYAGTAVRTTGGLSWLAADHHRTATHAIDATTLNVTTRRTDPYGNPRGTTTGGTWPDDKTFLGAPQDPTGLVHLGAREYDPGTGRFISLDPVMDLTDPQQIHGYTYANNSPTTWTDPTGLFFVEDTAGTGRRAFASKASSGTTKITISGGGGGATRKAPTAASSVERHGLTRKVSPSGVTSLNDWVLPAGGPENLAAFATAVDLLMHNHGMAVDETYLAIMWYCETHGVDICGSQFYKEVHRRINALTEEEVMLAAGMSTSAGGRYAMAPINGRIGILKAQASGMSSRQIAGMNRGWYCRANSFAPGTLVLMADGTNKPIEHVQFGDEVLATNPDTGSTSAGTVTHAITGTGEKDLVTLRIKREIEPTSTATTTSASTVNDGRLDIITSTAGHPFWATNRSAWVNAGDLQQSDTVLTADERRVGVVVSVSYTASATVHNITVADAQTYYVVAGSTSLLVHNCSDAGARAQAPKMGPTSGKPNWRDGSISPGEGWEWRGPGAPGTTNRGAWYNQGTRETLHPDLNHSGPIGPHYDYRAPDGTFHRLFPDGRIEPK